MNCALCGKETGRDVVHMEDNYYHEPCYKFIVFACDNTKLARNVTHNVKKYRLEIAGEVLGEAKIKKQDVKYKNRRLHKGWSREPMTNFVDKPDKDFKDMGEMKEFLDQKQQDKRKLYFYKK